MKLIKAVIILFALLVILPDNGYANSSDFKERVSEMAVVKSIRIGASLDHVRIVIDSSKAMEYKTLVLTNPGRVVVDISNAWVSPEVSRETIIGSRFANKIRVGQFNSNTVRVVIETTVKKENYDIFSLNVDGSAPRLVMDFGKKGIGSRENGGMTSVTEKKSVPKGTNDNKKIKKDKKECKNRHVKMG